MSIIIASIVIVISIINMTSIMIRMIIMIGLDSGTWALGRQAGSPKPVWLPLASEHPAFLGQEELASSYEKEGPGALISEAPT